MSYVLVFFSDYLKPVAEKTLNHQIYGPCKQIVAKQFPHEGVIGRGVLHED
jgi:hypothetical protein